MKDYIVRNCDRCDNEDSICTSTGLCPTCLKKEQMDREEGEYLNDEQEKLERELE